MNIDQLKDKYKYEFFPKIREELIKLGTEKPDFVYNTDPDNTSCCYDGPAMDFNENPVGPECSGCIIGQALQRLGWDDLVELDFSGYVYQLIADCPTDITDVQVAQDSGTPWGQAIKLVSGS